MKSRKKLLERALEIHQQLEKDKPLYRELDEITNVLRLEKRRHRYRVKSYVIEVKDNFEKKNTVFRPAAVRRFELGFEWSPRKKAA